MLPQALLKMDCQALVARLIQEAVILTSAVKLGRSWRELAEKSAGLTKHQMQAYEIPYRGKSGDVSAEVRLSYMFYLAVTNGSQIMKI